MVGAILSIDVAEAWGVPGLIALYALGAIASSLAYRCSSLTRVGLVAAGPCAAYRRRLELSAHDSSIPLDLDRDMPYVLAFGLGRRLHKRVRAQATDGYLPMWLESALKHSPHESDSGYCWSAFYDGGLTGSGSGWSGGTFSDGGAAAGGGGASTSF